MFNWQAFFWDKKNYPFSPQAAVTGGGCQIAAMLPLGLID
jgi:hypothetical protein